MTPLVCFLKVAWMTLLGGHTYLYKLFSLHSDEGGKEKPKQSSGSLGTVRLIYLTTCLLCSCALGLKAVYMRAWEEVERCGVCRQSIQEGDQLGAPVIWCATGTENARHWSSWKKAWCLMFAFSGAFKEKRTVDKQAILEDFNNNKVIGNAFKVLQLLMLSIKT